MTSSNKVLTGAATALLIGSGGLAQAQSSVQTYGLLDMSVGQFQLAGEAKVKKAESGKMTTSFLGFRGTEDLGGGLKAKFQLEHFFLADTGTAGRFGADVFWARAAWVGLQGSFGQVTLGRNDNLVFVSSLAFNAFGGSFGYSPTIQQVFTPRSGMLPFYGDSGWSNSIAYSGPKLGGLSFNFLGGLGEGAVGARGRNVSGSVNYAAGPLAATAVWQQVKHGAGLNGVSSPPVPAGFVSQTTYQFGVSYDLTVAKLFGQYGQVRTDANFDTKTTLYGVGASVPLGGGKALVQYGNAEAKSAIKRKNAILTLGYDYNLSKSTDVYAVFMNDKAQNKTGNTYAAGIRLRF